MNGLENRRPIKSRDAGWARGLARALAQAGATPDMISAASVLFARAGGALLGLSPSQEDGPRAAMLIGAALCVQLRLACNLIDGMVAVEHGRGGPAGPIWNELPDRVADALFLVGAGYGTGGAVAGLGEPLGWAAAVLAVLTAYVRELGRGLGFAADFSGPMAKPQRMAMLTIAALVASAETLWAWRGESLAVALVVIALGSALTVARRTARLAAALRAKG
jgi:phosphatidylglycerophosphate synthase